jgi:hypothetical protein
VSTKIKSESHVGELAIGVLLLCILALLMANILIYEVSVKHNESVCAAILKAAYNAAHEGKDKNSVLSAVQSERTRHYFQGLFVRAPQLVKFTDETKDNQRRITVQTQAEAHIPAQRLLIGYDSKTPLKVNCTYVAEVKVDKDDDDKDKNKSGDK